MKLTGAEVQKLATTWAKKFIKRQPSAAHIQEELQQEAALAIVKAMSGFNPSKGTFHPYAYRCALDLMRVYAVQQGACVQGHRHGAYMPDTMGLTYTDENGEEHPHAFLDPGVSGRQEELVIFKEQMRSTGADAPIVHARLHGYTLEEIGEANGCSREIVRRREARAVGNFK